MRLVFGLPLRQAEGFLRSLFGLMGVDLQVPDHTTLSRRGRGLGIRLRNSASAGPIHLIVDSTGLSTVGEGEWAAAKHGGKGRRGWKKLHLGVDGAGVIAAQSLTQGNADDANEGLVLLDSTDQAVKSFTGDGAYDSVAIYKAASERGARVVVPPSKAVRNSRRRKPRSAKRDRTIRRVQKVGRRRWKKESGYHRQGRVENTFCRWKSIMGGKLRAHHKDAQSTEALLVCNILNRMFELGRPRSVAVPR